MMRIIFALVLVGFAYFKYMASTEVVVNPYTGEQQRLALSPQQEIALGLRSVGPMSAQHGGELPDPKAQALVDRGGAKLLANAEKLARHGKPYPYPFEFHLLRDDQSVNAFALPGGQVFITAALFNKLQNEDQLAGVLGHEVGHVLAKHSNEQMSKSGLLKGLGGAAGTLLGGDSMGANSQIAGMVNHVLTMKYGRSDEYEADEIGVILMAAAGYDPNQMLGVLEILKKLGAGGRQSEMMSSHPYPENRIKRLKTEILPKVNKAIKR